MEGWLFQAERYFELHGVPPEPIIAFYMSGDALGWFQWMTLTRQIDSWSSFVSDLTTRFGPSAFWNSEVALKKLRQTTSVAVYIEAFETLSTRMPGLSTDNLLNQFMAGLKYGIHREIVLLKRRTLQAAMGIARIAEEKIAAIRTPNLKRGSIDRL